MGNLLSAVDELVGVEVADWPDAALAEAFV
jgi:hypothetical protein